MRQVREVLRLRTAGVGLNEIARRVGVAPSTVRLTLKRLATAGLSWPLPAEMTDGALETALFTAAGTKQGHRRHAEPDWAEIHRELKRKHVTLTMLWDEYIERCPDGYRYSRFCELYRGWASRLSVTMRQTHIGGDKLFVDYAGDTVPVIIDRLTGKIRPAQIFVAVLGASNFTYAEASWTQALADWIGAHTRAFAAHRRRAQAAGAGQHQGRRHQSLPLRAAGQSHLRRDGGALRHRDPAGTAAPAARQGEGRSRGADHRALAAGPAAPSPLLQSGRTQCGDRRVVAAAQRRTPDPAARCHPPGAASKSSTGPTSSRCRREPYCFAEWRVRRVGIDYHVEVEAHFYSVPHRFARSEVEVRLTPRAVEIFLKGERIAAHRRASGNHGIPPCPSTCRRAIGGTPTGRSSAFAARPLRSARAIAALCEDPGAPAQRS